MAMFLYKLLSCLITSSLLRMVIYLMFYYSHRCFSIIRGIFCTVGCAFCYLLRYLPSGPQPPTLDVDPDTRVLDYITAISLGYYPPKTVTLTSSKGISSLAALDQLIEQQAATYNFKIRITNIFACKIKMRITNIAAIISKMNNVTVE